MSISYTQHIFIVIYVVSVNAIEVKIEKMQEFETGYIQTPAFFHEPRAD